MRATLVIVCTVLLCAPALAQENYGFGIPGSSGEIPEISSNQAWIGRPDYEITVSKSAPFAQAFYLISGSPASTTISGIPIWVDTNDLAETSPGMLPFAITDGNGEANLGAALPNIPVLVGFSVYAQSIIIDFDPNTNLPASTDGVKITFTQPPQVAVGTSVGGGTDPFYLVDPVAQTLTHNSGSVFTDNSYDMTYTDNGNRLYLASSITKSLTVMDTSGGGAPAMSTLATFPGNCFVPRADETNKLLWILADLSTVSGVSDRQLVAIDIDLASPSYGSQVGNTTSIPQSGFVERWNLSPSGKQAAVLQVFGNALYLIDTDPFSPTFLQLIDTLFVPGTGFLNNRCAWSRDESQLVVIIQALGSTQSELARYDFAGGAWIDHNPNTPFVDNIGPSSFPVVFMGSGGVGLAVSPTEDAVFVSTINGQVSRIDYTGTSGSGFSITASPVLLPQVWDVHINQDGTMLAGPSWSPPELNFWDAETMSLLFSVSLPGGSNIYSVRWR